MSITVYPPKVRVGATALLVFEGRPNVTIAWYVEGSGYVTPKSAATDSRGRAWAIYTPWLPGNSRITVASGGA
jgi:hypothetical protein